MTLLIKRAGVEDDMDLVWRLLESDSFCLGFRNVLKNNVPELISVHHDKVR